MVTTATAPVEPLVDTFGRVHRDLRISVTDRCNFRCTYCMPADGLDWLPKEALLTYEEIERIARMLVRDLGIDAIRLTGGEPTLRAELAELVRRLADLGVDLSLTTNATRLRALAGPLADAGLGRVNVSLDSLDRERFKAMTRRDGLERVLDGLAAAQEAGLTPVKVNVVVQKGVNDGEVVDFATFGRERGITVRFIEYMPLDAEGSWRSDQVVSGAEILDRIGDRYPLEAGETGPQPAQRWRYLDGAGEIGVITSVTQPFCGDCDRIRLTAEGELRSCLFATDESDLRAPLRAGAADAELAELVRAEVAGKGPGHLIGQPTFIRPSRSMSQIGG